MSGRDFSEQDMLRVFREARDSFRFDCTSLRFNRFAIDHASDPAEIDRLLEWMPSHVSPSGRWRLPMDDEIDFLIRTGRAKTGDARHFYGDEGPYVFAREFMKIWLRSFETLSSERNEILTDATFYLMDKLSVAREAVWFLTQADWEKFIGPKELPVPIANPWAAGDMAQNSLDFKRRKAIRDCMKDLDQAFRAIVRLQDLMSARLENNPPRTGPGRKASEVRRGFVRHVANLFRLLTGRVAASSPDSPFAAFVESVWDSMADEVPSMSFQRTIADVCGLKT